MASRTLLVDVAIGVVLRVQKRYVEAEQAFHRALAANPQRPHAYLNLAVLYRKTDRRELADRFEVEGRRRSLGRAFLPSVADSPD